MTLCGVWESPRDLHGPYASRWSPDGRFIAALKDGSYALMIFDFTTQEWTEAFPSQVTYETFSHDGKYV
jgi:Tol biopolymer transport system component